MQVNILEAKTNLSNLVKLVETGKEDMVVIARYGKPVVKMVTYTDVPVSKRIGVAKGKLKSALKEASTNAVMPEIYQDEYEALLNYQIKQDEYDSLGKDIKAAQKTLDNLVLAKYETLTEEEIKYLLFDCKWMPRLYGDINGEIDRILNDYASRVIMIAKRYEHTLGEIEDKTAKSKAAVKQALERMGYKW